MNSARRIDTQTPSRRAARLLRGWWWVASALSVAACGSANANFSAGGSEAAGSGAAMAGASSTSAGSSNPSAAGASAGNAAGTSNGGASGSSNTSAAGGPARAGAGGSGAASSNVDACTACLCSHCPTEVETCESTPGCQAIADCVATSRCEGVACYCGTVDPLGCAAGTANGPCRDVILNAPSGHKPTLADQSAGPAADAAVAVATCGTKNGVCTASCQ
jgi:hypothetical protein